MVLCFVLIGFMGCGEKEQATPETTETQETTQSEVTETQTEPAPGTSEERGSYTLQFGPNETKSVTETFTGFILATGTTKITIRIQFIDITDPANPNVIRTATVSTGASFTLRNNFSGQTKTIKVEITNLTTESNTVYLTLQ
jgi:hypothetical protein